MSEVSTCPFSGVTLPGDGTPTRPSPSLAKWREESPATPLQYQDGHDGLIVTDYEFAKQVLTDTRFSMLPQRMPSGPNTFGENMAFGQHEPSLGEIPGPLDESAQISERSNLLMMDGEEHLRLRKLLLPLFTVARAKSHRDWISNMVGEQLLQLKNKSIHQAEIWSEYAKPIAARTHCKIVGIPQGSYEDFVRLFVNKSTAQSKYEFIRDLIDLRMAEPDDGVVSHLLTRSDFNRNEIEGLLRMLLSAGRDSVAYIITTTVVALLTNPDQLSRLLKSPELLESAVEEFMRFGSMFLTLFPRTAQEDIEIEGHLIRTGTSVSVSTVAANRDPKRFEKPDEFSVERDSFGHIGFSHGIHGCIGQQLARIEISEGISQLITGLPKLKLIDAEQLKPMPFAHPVAVYEAGEVHVSWGS